MKKVYVVFLGVIFSLLAIAVGATDFSATTANFGFITGARGNYVVAEAFLDKGKVSIASMQTIPPGSDRATESVRDGIRLGNGSYAIYNGTFDPVLSIFRNGSWRSFKFPGWSTVNNGTYGGLAGNNRYIFVTDMRTGGNPENREQGIIRFDLQGDVSATRFAQDIAPIDLTLGRNGMLYALYPGGSPGGHSIDVYNPNTLSKSRTISLRDLVGSDGNRSLAVDRNEDIYLANWDGEIQRIDRNGKRLKQAKIENANGSFYDIDLVGNNVILGNRFGQIVFTDKELSVSLSIALESLDPSLGNNGVFILGESAGF